MKKKILIFKNDRGGDLVSSVRLIYKLIENNNNVSIYLSNVNYNFNFLLSKLNIKKINFNLNFLDKVNVFLDLLKNQYDEVYILSPKNFYFYMPPIFRKTKFFAITINGKKRNRPSLYLRKYLHKYEVAYRTKLNKKNIIQNQLSLIDSDIKFNYKDLDLGQIDNHILQYLPEKFIFFQFKKSFFDQLNWSTKEFEKIIKFLETKNNFIVFSSDIENNIYDSYFFNKYSTIDFENKCTFTPKKKLNLIYLRKIDPKNLFLIIQKAEKILCPHGLVTQIAYLFNKKSVNMFSFKINSINDYHHQKISFSEWYSNMQINFTFLNEDVDKAIRKLSKFI